MHHLWRALCRTPYATLFLPLLTFVVLTIVLWLQNPGLYFSLLFSSHLSFFERLNVLGGIYTSLSTNFSAFGGTAVVILATLFAFYILLFILYIKRSRGVGKVESGTVGVMGFVAGLFGVGCAACGVVIFSSVIGVLGGGTFLAVLPFEGAEFAVLGSVILVFTIFFESLMTRWCVRLSSVILNTYENPYTKTRRVAARVTYHDLCLAHCFFGHRLWRD